VLVWVPLSPLRALHVTERVAPFCQRSAFSRRPLFRLCES
jgi:hypothetical protein